MAKQAVSREMSFQTNFVERLEDDADNERRFAKNTILYEQWLKQPDETLVKEDTPERANAGATLWNDHHHLFGAARHVCPGIPDDEYIWMNPCEVEYFVLQKSGIGGEHILKCPYCGAELAAGKGDVVLYKAPTKYWLFYLHYNIPMHNLGYQPAEDRQAIKEVWG